MARILILGGTAEAAELVARLAGDDRLETVTSLAGLTRLPNASGRVRRGGFGGPAGLAAFLNDERYDALIDATHPFAAQIAAHAAEAAEIAQVPRVKLVRPPFERTGCTCRSGCWPPCREFAPAGGAGSSRPQRTRARRFERRNGWEPTL